MSHSRKRTRGDLEKASVVPSLKGVRNAVEAGAKELKKAVDVLDKMARKLSEQNQQYKARKTHGPEFEAPSKRRKL